MGPDSLLLSELRFSRTSDPVGEFGRNVWNRGFPFPGSRILLMFRPIDR